MGHSLGSGVKGRVCVGVLCVDVSGRECSSHARLPLAHHEAESSVVERCDVAPRHLCEHATVDAIRRLYTNDLTNQLSGLTSQLSDLTSQLSDFTSQVSLTVRKHHAWIGFVDKRLS